MAYNLVFSKILSKNPLLKQQLMKANAELIPFRAHSAIRPANPWLNKPSLFNVEVIKKHYETIPILVFTTIGFTCEVLYTLRNALTRDDVCYNKKMAYENKSNIVKDKMPPVRKFRVVNQKYEWPPGLIGALREPTQEELDEMEKKKAKKKKK